MAQFSKNIVKVERTCWACPSQWEITLDDNTQIYVRFRHNKFRANHAQTIDEAVRSQGQEVPMLLDPNSKEINGYGWLSEQTLFDILTKAGYNYPSEIKDHLVAVERQFEDDNRAYDEVDTLSFLKQP